jgi:tRNA pseudouridine55 synthase
MYSAVKYRGKRLYRLARQGQVVPRQPRHIFVRQLDLLDRRGPLLTLRVVCSKGTYIRTLCEDIGLALGCGAHMVHLQRCRIGAFSLPQARSLEQLCRQARGDTPDRLCVPLAEALSFLPPLALTACQYSQYRMLQAGHGGAVAGLLATLPATSGAASSYRLCTPMGTTVAVLHRQAVTPEKWKLYNLV